VNKLLEIASAWFSAANPTPEQKEKAKKRLIICQSCEFKRENETLNIHYCGLCGCPLNKKIFTPVDGRTACPKGKWSV
jgi:hypothetical protein